MIKKLLKEPIYAILFFAATIAFSTWLLLAYHMGWQAVLFFEGCFLACGAGCLALYLLPRYRFYRDTLKAEQELKEKYMLYDVCERPGFFEGDMLCFLLEEAGRSMREQVAARERASREYREYVETWVHEVKTPIATGKLLVENNPSKAMEAMGEELSKIDSFIEQALYYARSSSAQKDYIIRKCSAEEIVRSALRAQARPLILKNIAVHLEQLEIEVYTDAKWLAFMLGQVFSNAAKYGAKTLRIWAEQERDNVLLHVADDGVGVCEQDLPRIFEKGFTGKNGRAFGKSTGMGLYLCKKLADKLGMGVSAYSGRKGGLRIDFVFPVGRLTEM